MAFFRGRLEDDVVMKNSSISLGLVAALIFLAYVSLPVMVKHSARAPLDSAPEARPGSARHSALVLNFGTGDEPATVNERDSAVHFDFEGRGRAVKTGWIGPEAGILALDRNRDGRIDDGRELFGDQTLGGAPGQGGFAALAREDTNRDGRISPEDENWDRLRIWRADNQGPATRRGLFTLAEMGVSEIELFQVPLRRRLPNGNYIHVTGSFRRADGRRGQVAEIYFQQNEFQRRFLQTLLPPPALEDSLLYLGGSGRVRDLQEALVQSPALRDEVGRFRRAATRREQRAVLDGLLTAWAATGGLARTIEERAAGRYRIQDSGLGHDRPEERARRLQVMEAFNGAYFHLLPDELSPAQSLPATVRVGGADGRDITIAFTPRQWQLVDQAYDLLADSVYAALAGQTRLARYFALLEPAPGASGPDLARLITQFDREIARDPENGLNDLLDFRLVLASAPDPVGARPVSYELLDRYIETRVRGRSLTDDQEQLYEKMKRARAAQRPGADPAQGGW